MAHQPSRRALLPPPILLAPTLLPFRALAAPPTLVAPSDLAQRLRQAKPGDTLLLPPGTWPDQDLLLEAEGLPHAPITIAAARPGQTIFTGHSRLRLNGRWLRLHGLHLHRCTTPTDLITLRHADHCEISACAVTDSTPANPNLTNRWLSLYGTHHLVHHCYFAGKRNPGPTAVVWVGPQPNHHRLHQNWFGPRPPLGQNGGETLRVGDSATSLQDSFTIFADNLLERCDGEIEAISNKSCGNLYRGNLLYLCQATLTLRHGNRCRVDSNVFFGGGLPATGGIRIIGEGHWVTNNLLWALTGDAFRAPIAVVNGLPNSPLNGYAPVRDVQILHNTLYGCRHGIAIGVSGNNRQLTLPPERLLLLANHTTPSPTTLLTNLPSAALPPLSDAEWVDSQTPLDLFGQPRGLRSAAGAYGRSPSNRTAPSAWLKHRLQAGPPWLARPKLTFSSRPVAG